MRTKTSIIWSIAGIILWANPVSLLGQNQTEPPDPGKPNVRIYVHKQTDENGNIISYDTIYTYSYSGKGYSNAYLDSVMKNLGTNMNGIFFSFPLNTPDLSNYPFIQQFNNADFDRLQQMMERQMNDMMQNYGMPPCNGFFCQPPPTPRCCPKDSANYRPQHFEKKSVPKHNKAKGGVQI